MNCLLNYLSLEDIEELKTKYELLIFKNLDAKNIKLIIDYLKNNKIDYIEDILKDYLDLFILDSKEFINKFEMLKKEYGNSFNEILSYNLNILEEMYK